MRRFCRYPARGLALRAFLLPRKRKGENRGTPIQKLVVNGDPILDEKGKPVLITDKTRPRDHWLKQHAKKKAITCAAPGNGSFGIHCGRYGILCFRGLTMTTYAVTL